MSDASAGSQPVLGVRTVVPFGTLSRRHSRLCRQPAPSRAEAVSSSRSESRPIATSRPAKCCLFRVYQLPDHVRTERGPVDPNSERSERVGDRVRDGGRRGQRPGLADTAHAERGVRGRHDVVHLQRGHLHGRREQVGGETGRRHLPRLVMADLLVERLPDALGDPAVYLAVDNPGVDADAVVVHRHEVEDLHLPGLRVHLDHGPRWRRRRS